MHSLLKNFGLALLRLQFKPESHRVSSRKIRVLIFSHCPPSPSWGGAMTFHRHFVESGDFAVLICYPSSFLHHQYPYSCLASCEHCATYQPRLWRRLLNTRLNGLLVGIQELFGGVFLRQSWIKKAKDFEPDFVFTVAGSWDWTPLAAQKLARILGVPLVASFNDWFDYGSYRAWSIFKPIIRWRFFRLFRSCNLALCTSTNMRSALGGGGHSHVLYPTGADPAKDEVGYAPQLHSASRPLRVLFGGSLGGWYGPMLEALVSSYLHDCSQALSFRIYGANQTWSPSFEKLADALGIYRGFVPFETLVAQARNSDVLLLTMGFGEQARVVESTSFKTKFLDYLGFYRPILVWGPEYCTAATVARQFDSAEIVTDPSPAACLDALHSLASRPERRKVLIANAAAMLAGEFHPKRIHQGLLSRLQALIGNSDPVESARTP